MGCEETLESIAVCIEQRHLTEWSAGDLDVLAAQARHAGTAIRVVHDLADSNR